MSTVKEATMKLFFLQEESKSLDNSSPQGNRHNFQDEIRNISCVASTWCISVTSKASSQKSNST
ncbi:hypothetical protein FRX31_027635 [Thalictrum thalictroides]|uniref:Uncharacterized protein n=1 Tax=Thalictrum thalictroides TaxID=46969 RepID=A0A7J6VDM1_THATH|nr:hypothetical protein FRX31_027635 [Thalictrum thalictroides]